MIYNDVSSLTVIETDNEWDIISHELVREYNIESPTDSIYFVSQGKLYGIICNSDVILSDPIRINKSFKYILDEDYISILEILRNHPSITFLPRLDEEHRLIGEYSNADSILFLESIVNSVATKNPIKSLDIFDNKVLKKTFSKLAIVKLSKNQKRVNHLVERAYKLLLSYGYKIDLLGSIKELNIDDYDYSIFINNYTWYPYYPYGERYYFFHKRIDMLRLINEDFEYYAINKIKAVGVTPVFLYFDSDKHPYCKNLQKEILKDTFPLLNETNKDGVYVKLNQSFFGEYFSSEYVKSIIDINSSPRHLVDGNVFFSEISSEYFNVNSKGERLTLNQPKDYDRTIFFFGPCLIIGNYAEDKHTLESFLQSKLLESGINNVRIVNYGDFSGGSMKKMLYILEKEARPGDIFIYMGSTFTDKGVISINLSDIVEENKPLSSNFTNLLIHCNYKGLKMYADGLYERLLPILTQNITTNDIKEFETQDNNNIDIDLEFYLNKYFNSFKPKTNNHIGAIVMNCNPFTKGHRYLIEEASKRCDILIVFVVQSNNSTFSFNSRFYMVYEGTKDIPNVRVVPSGTLILSASIFPEYFKKLENETTAINARKDIEIFATKIAPALNIKTRFVGEESHDIVTNHYNDAMKDILPKYGIDLIEIPRIEQNGEIVSGTRVRDCIKNKDYDSLSKLVPKSTLEFIKCNYSLHF